jgi:Xaa-Pro aminopeptidase
MLSTLTPEGCAARRARLWQALPEPCDILIITAPESLIYLANYAPSPFVFNTVEGAATLILWPDRSILVADNLLRPFLDRSCVDEIVELDWYTGRKSAPPRHLEHAAGVARQLQRRSAERIGIESLGPALLGLAGLEKSRPLILDPLIRTLRRAKDPDELLLIRRSVQAGEAAHAAAIAQIRPGFTELEAFLTVQSSAMRELGEQVVVYGDFVSGPRCETERGGPPGHRVIERGNLLLLDFSVVVHGYRADFTNTFVVDGEPTPRQIKMYEICMEALTTGEALLRPDVPAAQVDVAVRNCFARHGMAEYFPSHTGHGLGLGHPEPPYLVPESIDTLQARDVVALEPGLYLPGVGGMRFERNYLITERGFELLTRHQLGLTPRVN